MPKAKTTYPLKALMAKAWALARAGGRRHGGRAVQYLATALRQAWADHKRAAADLAAMRACVLAEVERIKAELAAERATPAPLPAWAIRHPRAQRWSAYR